MAARTRKTRPGRTTARARSDCGRSLLPPRRRAPEGLDVEEHRFAFTLQADVETVDRRLLPSVFAPRGQGRAARFPFDQGDRRVRRGCLSLLGEIQTRALPLVESAPLET